MASVGFTQAPGASSTRRGPRSMMWTSGATKAGPAISTRIKTIRRIGQVRGMGGSDTMGGMATNTWTAGRTVRRTRTRTRTGLTGRTSYCPPARRTGSMTPTWHAITRRTSRARGHSAAASGSRASSAIRSSTGPRSPSRSSDRRASRRCSSICSLRWATLRSSSAGRRSSTHTTKVRLCAKSSVLTVKGCCQHCSPSLRAPRDLRTKGFQRLARTELEVVLAAYPAPGSRLRHFNYVYEIACYFDHDGRSVESAHELADAVVSFLRRHPVTEEDGGASLEVYRDVMLDAYCEAKLDCAKKGQYPPPLAHYVGWHQGSHLIPLQSCRGVFYDRVMAHLRSEKSGAPLIQWTIKGVAAYFAQDPNGWGPIFELRIVATTESIRSWATLSGQMAMEAIVMYLRRCLIEHGGCNIVGGGRNTVGSPSQALLEKVERAHPRFALDIDSLGLLRIQSILVRKLTAHLAPAQRTDRAAVLAVLDPVFRRTRKRGMQLGANPNRVAAARARVERERAQEATQRARQKAHLAGIDYDPNTAVARPTPELFQGSHLRDFSKRPCGESVRLYWTKRPNGRWTTQISTLVTSPHGNFVHRRNLSLRAPVGTRADQDRPSHAWLWWNRQQHWLELRQPDGQLLRVQRQGKGQSCTSPAIWTPYMLAQSARSDGWLLCLPADEQQLALGVSAQRCVVLISIAIYEASPKLIELNTQENALRRITLARFEAQRVSAAHWQPADPRRAGQATSTTSVERPVICAIARYRTDGAPATTSRSADARRPPSWPESGIGSRLRPSASPSSQDRQDLFAGSAEYSC